MNSCLKKPCEKGFAFYRGIPVQLDHSGAFRYTKIAYDLILHNDWQCCWIFWSNTDFKNEDQDLVRKRENFYLIKQSDSQYIDVDLGYDIMHIGKRKII